MRSFAERVENRPRFDVGSRRRHKAPEVRADGSPATPVRSCAPARIQPTGMASRMSVGAVERLPRAVRAMRESAGCAAARPGRQSPRCVYSQVLNGQRPPIMSLFRRRQTRGSRAHPPARSSDETDVGVRLRSRSCHRRDERGHIPREWTRGPGSRGHLRLLGEMIRSGRADREARRAHRPSWHPQGRDTSRGSSASSQRSDRYSTLPVLLPNFSVGTPTLLSTVTHRFAIGVVLLILPMPAAFRRAGGPADHQRRQVELEVQVAVAHARAVDEQRVIEDRCRRRRACCAACRGSRRTASCDTC